MKLNFQNILVFTCIIIFSCVQKRDLITNPKQELNYIPYYLKVYEADSLYLTDNYQRSYEILDSLFKKFKPLNMENYYEYGNYLGAAVMSGNIKNLKEKVKYSYENFGDIRSSHPNSYEITERVQQISGFKINEIKLFKNKYAESINTQLRERLKIMYYEDQEARDNYDRDKIDFLQKKHKAELEDIIATYGYPNYIVIGSINWYDDRPIDVNVLLLHQDSEVKEKYLPLLKKMVIEGKCAPTDYSSIYDKNMISKSKAENGKEEQYYYSFPTKAKFDHKKADSLRRTIGLPKLGYQQWRFDKIINK